MKIVAVDNFEKRLMELVSTLRELFPDDEITHFTDPLFALKHIFYNDVDVVFAESEMRPVDGGKLSRIINEQYKDTAVYCLTDTERKDSTAGPANNLTRPVTEDIIRNLLRTA